MTSSATVDHLNQRARLLSREHSTEALSCAQQAAMYAIPLHYDKGFTEALFIQGNTLGLQGSFDEALPLMRHALFLAQQHQYTELIADCLQEIARTCYTQGAYIEALDAWVQCLDIAQAINATDIYIKAQIGLGQLYFAHDDYENALNHHLKARDYASHCQDANLLSAIEINIGIDQFEMADLDNAKNSLHQALVYAQQARNLEYQASAMGTLGRLALVNADNALARSFLERARGINQKHENRWAEAHNLYDLGLLARAEKKQDLAINYFRQALNNADELSAVHLQFKIEFSLAEVLEELSDFASALHYHRCGYQHHYQLLRQASPQRLHTIQAMLEAEKTRLENNILREQHDQERKARQYSENIASQDALTGLLNRRGFELRSNGTLQSDPSHSEPLALLMLDIDFFKRVNDQWGHPVGDNVLRQVAALLKSGCRQDDLVCRWGGEEFVILLPSHNGVAAIDVAERLRKMVEEWPWEQIEPGLNTTISIGVTQYQNDSSLSTLVQRADLNLYQAKQAGRNRVVS